MVVKTFEGIGKVRSFEEIGQVPSFEEIEPQKKTGLIGEALLSVEPDAEDIEKYQRMGVKEYRSPADKLYDLTEPKPRTKGPGYFGELKRPDGKVSTELSIGVNIEGKETEIPSLVPTLTKTEKDYLLAGNKPSKEIVRKAVDHAKKRIAEGKSPFAQAPAKPIGLLERGAKGFGRSFTNVLKAIETKSRVVGGMGQQLETYDLVQQFRDKTGRAPSADEFLQISKQAQVNIEAESAGRYKALDVPPPETIPEKATEIGAGLAGFITKLTLTKKALGVPRGSLGGDVAAWEALNLAEGGTPGTGAAFRLMLAATGKIPTVTKAAKAGRVGVESGLFAGLSALRGDDPEVIAMHALIPIAFQAYATTKGRISDAQMVKSWRQRLPFMRDVPVTSSLKMARASRALYEIRNPKLSPKMRQKLAVQWEKRFGTSVDKFLKEMDVAFKAVEPPVPEQIEGRIIQPPTAVKPTEAPRMAVKPPVTPVAAITPTKPTPTAPKVTVDRFGHSLSVGYNTERVLPDGRVATTRHTSKLHAHRFDPRNPTEGIKRAKEDAERMARKLGVDTYTIELPTGVETIKVTTEPTPEAPKAEIEGKAKRAKRYERVIKKLQTGKYKGKIQAADYANVGLQQFQDEKMASDLGLGTYQLERLLPIQITEQAGWDLPTEPTVEEFKAAIPRIEKWSLLKEKSFNAHQKGDYDLAAKYGKQADELLQAKPTKPTPAPEIAAEKPAAKLPEGYKIQKIAGQYDIYRPDGERAGTRPTEAAAIKYARVYEKEFQMSPKPEAPAAKPEAAPEIAAEKPLAKITSGYPPVEFEFTGRWTIQERGFYRAERNKQRIKVPIYKSADGKEILYMEGAVKAPKQAAPEIAAEKPVKPEIRDLSDRTRKRAIRETEGKIKQHEIYQLEVSGIEQMTSEIGPGYYYVPPKQKSEVLDVSGKPGQKGFKKALYDSFTFTDVKATSWAKAAQERGIEDIDISTFVRRVDAAIEAGKKVGVLNQRAIERAITSGDLHFELLAMKHEMLKNNYSAGEINDTIRQWARDNNIDEADVKPELVPVEEVKYEPTKRELLRKVEKKGRAAKAKLTPEQSAILKAKDAATKTKRDVYIYKKAGRFTVSKNPPSRGEYTKISPPAAGEVTAKVTKETATPIPKTQKGAAIIRAKAAAKKTGKDVYVRQNQEGRFFATKNKPISNYYIVNPKGQVEFVKGPVMANVLQRTAAYETAQEKGLINQKGKPTQGYRRFAKAMTGKTNIDAMTEEEAAHFVEMMKMLVVGPRGIAKIPTSTDIITKELADKIGKFKDIGALEKIRPAWRVFEKMGLYKEVFEPAFEAEISSIEELFGFRKEAKDMQKLVGKDKAVSRKLFRAIENPGKIKLTHNEKRIVKWARKYFDNWADRLGLTPEQRRKNYITHIFEADISQLLKEKHPLDPDLIRALEFITPKTVFHPYLQKRLGKKVGLKEDFWAAVEAYENRSIKKFYYEPLIKRIRVYQRFLPPNSARYLRNYTARITSRPLTIDREFNQTLKEVAQDISKLPGGEKLAQYLTKGNASGMLAYNMTGVYYEAWLGLRPASAIKNLSQHGLILAESGPVAFGRALKTVGRERAKLLLNSKVLRSRKSGYLPGIDQTYIKNLESKRRKVTMAMFRAADRQNVSDAFLAGYHEAKAKGLPDEWAYKRGDEVAAKTQWLYSKLAGAEFMQTSPGRVLGVLTTWPENWAELMNDWIRAKPSKVYSDYAKETGKEIPKVNWAKRRKSLWTYLAMVSLAMLIHKKTPFKAIYYTGWTSIRSLVDIASGKLAGLEIPRIIGNLIAGLALGDKRRIKQSWNEMKRFIVIRKELSDIITGKKDWMNLFVYMEKPKKKSGKREKRKMREKRMLRKR